MKIIAVQEHSPVLLVKNQSFSKILKDTLLNVYSISKLNNNSINSYSRIKISNINKKKKRIRMLFKKMF